MKVNDGCCFAPPDWTDHRRTELKYVVNCREKGGRFTHVSKMTEDKQNSIVAMEISMSGLTSCNYEAGTL